MSDGSSPTGSPKRSPAKSAALAGPPGLGLVLGSMIGVFLGNPGFFGMVGTVAGFAVSGVQIYRKLKRPFR